MTPTRKTLLKLFSLCGALLLTPTYAQDVGKLLLLSFSGTEAPVERLGLSPAGFIFFPSNLETLDGTRALTSRLRNQADYPLLLGVDGEGGVVSSFRVPGATMFPGNPALGAAGSEVLARAVGRAVGAELAYAGLNLNFAPVVDVFNEPANPIIGPRSFGADPAAVGRLGAAVAEGLAASGVAAVAKHFPGHGGTAADSHQELPVVTKSREALEGLELEPFRALIGAGVPAVMSAHVVYTALDDEPATVSKPILTDLLRRDLGFRGVVVSDALNMRAITEHYGPGEAAVRSVQAGADLLLLVADESTQNEVYRALQEALESGRLSAARVREANRRVARLAQRYAPQAPPRPDYAAHRRLAQHVAASGATLLWDGGALPIGAADEVLVVAPQPGGYGDAQHLGSVFKAVRGGVRSVVISEDPTAAEHAEALAKAATSDVVVLASYHGFGGFPPGLRTLQADLAALPTPLVVVALGRPDDADFFTARPDAYAAVYGFRDANLEAARDLLLGLRTPTGRLPVPVGEVPVDLARRPDEP